MEKKKIIKIVSVIVAVLLIVVIAVCVVNSTKTEKTAETENIVDASEVMENLEKVDIIDLNSNTRPLAVVVNNTPVAVKVQTGLNKAYLVYEIPTEGYTSRLMALYKDAGDVTIGTIRSARHNFIDLAYESDAIFCHWGWSHYAQDDEQKNIIDYINELIHPTPFWRNNPENLASEHTGYTSTTKLYDYAKQLGYSTTTDPEKSTLLNYNVSDVNLSENEKAIKAETITIPYDGSSNITTFKYNAETGMYERYEAGKLCTDHETGETVTTKNIVLYKINHAMASDNHYWDLSLVGSGKGYFITNGYAVPINWSKSDRKAQTKFTYDDGSEIEVSDGRTYIEIMGTDKTETIE